MHVWDMTPLYEGYSSHIRLISSPDNNSERRIKTASTIFQCGPLPLQPIFFSHLTTSFCKPSVYHFFFFVTRIWTTGELLASPRHLMDTRLSQKLLYHSSPSMWFIQTLVNMLQSVLQTLRNVLQSHLQTHLTVNNEFQLVLNLPSPEISSPYAAPTLDSTGQIPFVIIKRGKTAATCKFHH